MTKSPLITVGICCYNSADTVGRAIDSALAQDWDNFEIIVVDDGSNDNSIQVIEEKIRGRPNARLIKHTTNKYFPAALNTVIKNANGTLIAIFDDDDESLPHRLSAQYKALTEYEASTNAHLVACWCSGVRRYPNGYEVKLCAIGSQPKVPIGSTVADYLLFNGKKPGYFYGSGTPSCGLMVRKSTYSVIGLYDESMFRSEDSDFAIRLAKHGGHFIGCKDEVLIQYSTGGTEKRPEATYNSFMLLVDKHRDYLIGKGVLEYTQLWAKLRLFHFSRQKIPALGLLAIILFKYPAKAWSHFFESAPRRLIHEWKMGRKKRLVI